MEKDKDKSKDEGKEIKENKLGVLPIPQLIRQFAVPSIVAMLVGALYNIVDQFFIGRSIGENCFCGLQFRRSSAFWSARSTTSSIRFLLDRGSGCSGMPRPMWHFR